MFHQTQQPTAEQINNVGHNRQRQLSCRESHPSTQHNDHTHNGPFNRQKNTGAKPSDNVLFVGNLSYFCEETHLFDLFDQYTQVNGIRIIRNDLRTRSLMYGFVTLPSHHDALEMERMLNGTFFMGRRLKVALSGGGSKQNDDDVDANAIPVHCAFSSSFPADGKIVRPTEAWLRKQFTQYGVIVDCVVKEYQQYKQSDLQEGYGFIVFANYDDAALATSKVQENHIDGITLSCKMSHVPPVIAPALHTPASNRGLPANRYPADGIFDGRTQFHSQRPIGHGYAHDGPKQRRSPNNGDFRQDRMKPMNIPSFQSRTDHENDSGLDPHTPDSGSVTSQYTPQGAGMAPPMTMYPPRYHFVSSPPPMDYYANQTFPVSSSPPIAYVPVGVPSNVNVPSMYGGAYIYPYATNVPQAPAASSNNNPGYPYDGDVRSVDEH